MPKVSIVLPTYNGERYLCESIDSVLNQSYSDWELIIVNDCSSDNTPLIINEYAKKDERIIVINNKQNRKLPRSLNVGFDVAKGDYLTWTSDDNYYFPNAIECMVEYLDNNRDIVMTCADMEFIDGIGNNKGVLYSYKEKNMYYNDCVGACFMYRRNVLLDIGQYDPNWFLVEDYEYWLRILFHGGKIGRLNKTLYCYRYHDNSLTGKRATEIRQQLVRLRIRYAQKILVNLKDEKQLLCAMFYEQKMSGIHDAVMENEFIALVPELKIDKINLDDRDLIIYGAGDYGDKAYSLFNNRIAYFADSNLQKVGKKKYNVEIVSVNEMVRLSHNYQIVIAVSEEKIWSLLNKLFVLGIKKCNVLQSVEKGE